VTQFNQSANQNRPDLFDCFIFVEINYWNQSADYSACRKERRQWIL